MRRIKDLFIKLCSIKTIPAIIFTVGYFQHPDLVSTGSCLIAWALVIGVRYAEKIKGLVKG